MDKYKVRFVALGGIVGVTKNMYVYEIYENEVLKDILIIDCGIGFPHEKELGVDFVIPDITYLKDKIDKIRAVVLTHGHEDHISALPFHYLELGKPPVYTSKLTAAFIENKFKEFNQPVNVTEVKYGEVYQFGDFKLNFLPVTHSIPDTMHVVIKTPVGNLYHGTDFKMDLTPPFGPPPDFYGITKAGNEGILCLFSDSLGSEREGLTLSEAIVGQVFEDEMRKTKGKFIMTTFSSNISRIRQCVDAAIKFNRKIVFLGRSMRENTRLSAEIGYLPIPNALTAKEEDVRRLPPNKVCLIVAGSQGQYESALSKLANNKNKNVKIKPGDKVIFSSDPIPGNENEVYNVIEELSLQGAEVIYSDIHDELHASGHGNQDDLKFLIRFTKPRYFIPIGGTLRHQLQYQKLVGELGYPKENVFTLEIGETVWFTRNNAYKGDELETKTIYVDAYGVGDVGNMVLRDRKTLSSEGIVVALIMVDSNGRLLARPNIVSRGFVFEKAEEELFEKAARLVEKVLKPRKEHIIDLGIIKKDVEGYLEKFFYQEKGRKPLIVVDVIQI
ncbi:MAG: ribonuclease J [Candidatus Roizmanbacteria bacterium]|nr:MAG: ribonuclease J [Candidatus Roizmanbacteria bacterium]